MEGNAATVTEATVVTAEWHQCSKGIDGLRGLAAATLATKAQKASFQMRDPIKRNTPH